MVTDALCFVCVCFLWVPKWSSEMPHRQPFGNNIDIVKGQHQPLQGSWCTRESPTRDQSPPLKMDKQIIELWAFVCQEAKKWATVEDGWVTMVTDAEVKTLQAMDLTKPG